MLLEGGHNLFLRRIGDLEAFQHLLWLVARTNKHILWGLCMGKYANGYLAKCFPLNKLFHFELNIPSLQPGTLRRLIMARHNQSGYRLQYLSDKRLEKILRRRVKRWTHLEEPAVQEALEQIVFERLADVCGENIVVAFYYWMRSLHPTGEDSFEVAPMEALDLDLVRGFSMDQAYLLNAVLQHDNLDAQELASILDSGLIQTRLDVEILINQNIMDIDEKGFFRVNPVALKPAASPTPTPAPWTARWWSISISPPRSSWARWRISPARRSSPPSWPSSTNPWWSMSRTSSRRPT